MPKFSPNNLPNSRALVRLCLLATLLAATAQAQTLRERWQERLQTRAAQRATPAAANPAGLQEHTLNVTGQSRRYLLYVPQSLGANQSAPLVLAFHGGGGHAEFMADDARYGLQSMAERHGYIVAFPNGYSKLPGGKLATWNAGGCCGDARDRHVDDVAFARAVVADVAALHPIDRNRVFATGMSNGAMMSYRLACEAADLFRAVAAVAGTDATASCQPAKPVSVLHIHAQDDDHVLFNGGAGPQAFRDPSKVMDYVSVPETVQHWVSRNHCAVTTQHTALQTGASCDTYNACAGASQVKLCVTDSGGHSWPGAQTVRRGKEPASQALDASEVIGTFFQQVGAAP
jgi:polyhydroxybutyrate depolymerase